MKVLDNEQLETARTIEELVGPEWKDMAFQGGYDGASRIDRDLGQWHPPLVSADQEQLVDKDVLDARSRDLHRNNPHAFTATEVHKDSIVGAMYVLNSRPNAAVLGWDETRTEAFQLEVEAKFQTWAESDHRWVDAARKLDLTEMIRLVVGVFVFGGEALATAEWMKNKSRQFRTAVQLIDCDRLKTPSDKAYNPYIRGGIKHDIYGGAVSAFIRKHHPNDYFNGVMYADHTAYKEVGFRKPWGRMQVLHIQDHQRIDQSRAVSRFTAGLRDMAIGKKFRDITLQNAVVNATYAASIESEMPTDVIMQQLGAGNTGTGADAVTTYAEAYLGAINEYIGSSKHMRIDGVKIPHLFPGTKLNLSPVGTPGGVGQDFEASLLRTTARLLGISYEELTGDFTKSNYASFRGAVMTTWKHMQGQKKIVADRMANFVFRLWLEEAINAGEIESFPASEAHKLYTNGHQNLMFDAIAKAEWIGAARGQIDELKETQAATLRIKFGLSTHEDELARLGKDWRQVYAQLGREQAMRKEKGIELMEDNSVNAASGATREADDGDKDSADADDE